MAPCSLVDYDQFGGTLAFAYLADAGGLLHRTSCSIRGTQCLHFEAVHLSWRPRQYISWKCWKQWPRLQGTICSKTLVSILNCRPNRKCYVFMNVISFSDTLLWRRKQQASLKCTKLPVNTASCARRVTCMKDVRSRNVFILCNFFSYFKAKAGGLL